MRVSTRQAVYACSVSHPKGTQSYHSLDKLQRLTGQPRPDCLAALRRAHVKGLIELRGGPIHHAWVSELGKSYLYGSGA